MVLRSTLCLKNDGLITPEGDIRVRVLWSNATSKKPIGRSRELDMHRNDNAVVWL